MNKNLIPEIAKMLGVELGEEFKAVSKDGSERVCVLNHDGLLDNTRYVYYNKELFTDIVCGNAEIVKLPWKPKKGDVFWTFNSFFHGSKWEITSFIWRNEAFDNTVFKAGWAFRTRAEAEAALPNVAKEVGVEYEI